MKIYKVKQMYDISKEVEFDVHLFQHGVESREEAQDIIRCVSNAIGLSFVEKKSSDKKTGWFGITNNNFAFSVFFELSQEEQDAFKPREVLV